MGGLWLTASLLMLVSVLCFTAERCFSLFGWSKLEAMPLIPRTRRMAIERCLAERELVETCFVVIGVVALVAGVLAFVATHPINDWINLVEAAGVALVVTWLIPEAALWVLQDRIVLHVVPPLYAVIGPPFRIVRAMSDASREPDPGEVSPPTGERAGAHSPLDAAAQTFFKDAVRLRHTAVREIMTPRTQMVSVSETATLREVAEISLKSGLSRFPVYRGNRDHMVGILHVKDLLSFAATDRWDKPLSPRLMRTPPLVPETKPIADLIEEFRRSKIHMAIVVDEYGGTAGIVTLEDVLEELVGEIYDEHETAEPEEPLFTRLDAASVEVQGIMRIERFNEEFDFDLPDHEDFATIGGFVNCMFGHIPRVGESFDHGAAKFTVTAADERRVIRVRVEFGERRGAGEPPG